MAIHPLYLIVLTKINDNIVFIHFRYCLQYLCFSVSIFVIRIRVLKSEFIFVIAVNKTWSLRFVRNVHCDFNKLLCNLKNA